MKIIKTLIMFCLCIVLNATAAEMVGSSFSQKETLWTFSLSNARIILSVAFRDGILLSDVLETTMDSAVCPFPIRSRLESDADFRLQVVWTDWLAPGKMNNGDNPVIFSKSDFRLQDYKIKEASDGAKELTFFLRGINQNLELQIVYRLEPDKFYAQRKLAVRDNEAGNHFLEKTAVVCTKMRLDVLEAAQAAVKALIEGSSDAVAMEAETTENSSGEKLVVIHKGGFGQPVALASGVAGAFWGLEYPAANNQVTVKGGNSAEVSCWLDCGKKIEKEWLETEWLVWALAPDQMVKKWFWSYLDDIRVTPLRPYALYNSWYDLRSAEYPKVPAANVMNETNVRRMVDLVRENMIEKHGIKLDAFVLDDGWDVYESDWQLRPEQFPNGLGPISVELAKTGTALGIWFGPGGGYSFRMKRIDWMKAHGYEVVGQGKDRAMLCLGGKNYSQLFGKRAGDFVEQAGIGYFKWDGIQFSCSEPDHGHPIGIFSRAAILDSLIEQCRIVRRKNPAVFLNITSGTWLSPWWLKYADTIWMDGADYAFAGVPSPTDRDSAMTYRDYVLYDDFSNKGLWFPIASLMTHGIIKGKLESISGGEPLAKFSDDVLLYFGRGVAMYELYISPDMLSPGEWKVISRGLNWARDRFPVLRHSEMIGGNPGRGVTYGYVHFTGKKGIIAARNPGKEASCLEAVLDPAAGLDADAASLVVEQVYPVRRVWPELYAAGSRVRIPLSGFETVIYEIYPLSEASTPLLAGVISENKANSNGEYTLRCFAAGSDIRLLNPETVRSMNKKGLPLTFPELAKAIPAAPPALTAATFSSVQKERLHKTRLGFTIAPSVSEAVLAVLLEQAAVVTGKNFPEVQIKIDGKIIKADVKKQDGAFAWYSVKVTPGRHLGEIAVQSAPGNQFWSGSLSARVNVLQQPPAIDINFSLVGTANERVMPPLSEAPGTLRLSFKLGEEQLRIGLLKQVPGAVSKLTQ
ncbi:MAG: alpha-galactosidase [Chrysiogenales bacterium]